MPLLILVFAQMSAKLARLIENTLWLKCFGWPPALCERVLAQGLMWLKKKDSICHYPINGYGSLRHHMVMWLPIGPHECLKIKLTFSKYTFYAPPGDGFVQTWVIIFGKWPAERGMGIKLAHILLTKYIKLVKCEFVATAKMSWTNCLWFSCVRVHLKTMHYTWAGNLYFICMSKRRKLRKTPTSWTSSSTWGCWR